MVQSGRRRPDWAGEAVEKLRDYDTSRKLLYQATLVQGAPQEAFGAYYRYIRAELFQKCGLEHEQPGEASKKKWNAIRIPDRITHKEDLNGVIETIVQVYQILVRHGMIIPGNEHDERRLEVDLSEKVEHGTAFRMWFYGGDTLIDIRTVRQWLDRARKYVA